LEAHEFNGFFIMFLLLFITTGVGNASTFKMIPVIFLNERMRAMSSKSQAQEEQARRDAAKESSAILGFSSALGAYGGFIIPITFGNAIKSGSPQTALIEFLGFYIVCLVLTWWYYFRKNAEAPC
jgi:NNP family nitrate/nitrite transporter-like MFS transporter